MSPVRMIPRKTICLVGQIRCIIEQSPKRKRTWRLRRRDWTTRLRPSVNVMRRLCGCCNCDQGSAIGSGVSYPSPAKAWGGSIANEVSDRGGLSRRVQRCWVIASPVPRDAGNTCAPTLAETPHPTGLSAGHPPRRSLCSPGEGDERAGRTSSFTYSELTPLQRQPTGLRAMTQRNFASSSSCATISARSTTSPASWINLKLVAASCWLKYISVPSHSPGQSAASAPRLARRIPPG